MGFKKHERFIAGPHQTFVPTWFRVLAVAPNSVIGVETEALMIGVKGVEGVCARIDVGSVAGVAGIVVALFAEWASAVRFVAFRLASSVPLLPALISSARSAYDSELDSISCPCC